MLENLARAITEITTFTNEHRIDAEYHLHRVNELREDTPERNAFWAKFEKRSGVYCILCASGSSAKYIGMSQVDTGSRVFPWIFPRPEQSGTKDNRAVPEDVVLSVVLERQPYMAPALESYLIARLHPEFNRKR